MSIFKTLTLIVSMAVLLAFSGCQGDNSDIITQGSDANMTVILPISTTEVTTNSEVVNIEVKVIDENNNLFTTGSVKIIYPNDVREGRDIGYFEEDTVLIEKGVANFIYNAPSNIASDTSSISFDFYHDSDPTQTKRYTVVINPEEGLVVLSNYNLGSDIGTDVSMGLETRKLVSFYVENDKNELVLDSDIVSIKITSENPNIGTLEDTSGNSGISITINGKNTVSVGVNSNIKSGIIPLKVETSFIDANGDTLSLSEVFNVIVLSGPPSAISLSYVSTIHTQELKDRAKFVEEWAVTVTDKYNNLVDSNPAVSMGMLAGYANDSSNGADNPGNYLYYQSGAQGGGLSSLYDNFTARDDVFDDVDLDNDVLTTFANGYTYNASGKWGISTKSSTVLGLKDDYDSTTTYNMGFAVGHNYRQDVCRDAVEWVANVYPKDNNFLVGDNGTMIINVEYDYYLTGKSTVLWVNLIGKDYSTDETVKIGEARKVNLRGLGLTGESYAFSKGFSGTVRLDVSITDTVEWYRNANFSGNIIVSGDDINWSIVGGSMTNGIMSCVNSGIGYVDVNISAVEAGSVSLVDVLTVREF